MSSRVSIYLESLVLDELLFLESELNRRKSKFKTEHVVMAVQSEQKVLTTFRREVVNLFAKDMRRYVNECAAAGSGVQLAYSPDISLLLFSRVDGAATAASLLLTGLAELNGKHGNDEHRIALKLGLACGVDTLAAGSMRSVRQSVLVRLASQSAWKAPAGTMLMDEAAAHSWTPRHEPVRVPIEIEGASIFRVTPNSATPLKPIADEDGLVEFLEFVKSREITTLKYSLLREEGENSERGAWSTQVATVSITLEAYDPQQLRNITFSTKCALSDYSGNVERIKRMVSDRGLGLVKHEEATSLSASQKEHR